MADAAFQLDSRLAADCLPLGRLPLCRVLLMDEQRWCWLILVPEQSQLVEVLDLAPEQRSTMWREVEAVAARLRELVQCDKLNLATLGNQVAQLHLHVIARHREDAAWPAPVWGTPRQPCPTQLRDQRLKLLRDGLRRLEGFRAS